MEITKLEELKIILKLRVDELCLHNYAESLRDGAKSVSEVLDDIKVWIHNNE